VSTTSHSRLPAHLQSSLHSFLLYSRPTPTAIYTLSLHAALPISLSDTCSMTDAIVFMSGLSPQNKNARSWSSLSCRRSSVISDRSEEHTSELQSRGHLVCRLLLGKNKPTRQASTCRPVTSTNLRR